MKKLFLILFSLVNIIVFSQDREVDYIKKYALLAVREMHQYKIPASITLAQGLLETGGGQSRLAEQANNHFGIKCKKEWDGETITHDDDALNECFRKYKSVEDSYKDHSEFLAKRPYYKKLFDLDITDYKGWAYGLKRAGYATNPRYAPILINKIEKYNLYKFDKIPNSPNEDDVVYTTLVNIFGPMDRRIMQPDYSEKPKVLLANKNDEKTGIKVNSTLRKIEKEHKYVNNLDKNYTPPQKKKIIIHVPPLDKKRIRLHPVGREYIIVYKGETIKKIAKAFNIKEKRLMCYNDLTDPRDLKVGQYLFLEKKRNKGSKKTYQVQSGDTMYSISQKMGIKLKCLYWRNRMKQDETPTMGDILYLRGRKPRT